MHKLSEKSAHKTTITLSILEWRTIQHVNEHEVKINHKLFDFDQVDYHQNVIVLKGSFDEKEDGLVKNSHQFWNKKISVEHLFTFLYCEALPIIRFKPIYSVVTKVFYNPSVELINSDVRIDHPPPDWA